MTIDAGAYVDPDGAIVRSAELLTEEVARRLHQGHAKVVVSFVGLKGLSSSYFNLFIKKVLWCAGGPTAFEQSIRCEFDSSIQQRVFNRSWRAITSEAA